MAVFLWRKRMSYSSTQFLDAGPIGADDAVAYGVLPVPFEATTSYGGGTQHGPQAIIDASSQVEFYDEELDCEPRRAGIVTYDAVDCCGVSGEDAITRIEQATALILGDGRVPVVLGGEHSITTGPVRACLAHAPAMGVLQIDAHGDLREQYEGSRWSHASVMKRIYELGCPTVGVGLRSLCEEERSLIRDARLPRWFAYDMASDDVWMQEAVAALPEHVYITVDVDGLDPSVIRATGTPEPGGLSWWTTMKFLRMVFAQRQVIGFDIVELAPSAHDHASSFAAARLVYKMIGYHLSGRC